ncbi:TPA: phage protein GemA/Gp16 family protein [Escherichia coli]
MSRTSLIKLIHVARRDLQLDDDTYRVFLVQCTGKTSCRELSVAQLERVLDAMKARGFKKQKKHPRRRFKGYVTPREKIYKIWHGAGIRRDTLPDSQFPAGQRTLSPAAQKAFPGRLPSNCRVVMGGLGRWFFHADIRHSLSEGALSAGILDGRYLLRGTL